MFKLRQPTIEKSGSIAENVLVTICWQKITYISSLLINLNIWLPGVIFKYNTEVITDILNFNSKSNTFTFAQLLEKFGELT